LDLEDEPACEVQQPIVLSDEEDTDFEEDEVPLQKRRRVHHRMDTKTKGGSSSGVGAPSLQREPTIPQDAPMEPDRKGKHSAGVE
jgi:hypothetical protein